MRLHLGCGPVYKKGYINVDAYDGSVADEMMSTVRLQFEDNTADVVESYQVLEHLGIARTIYSLAEVFRVLQPQGMFVLETPDIEVTFERFLKADEEQRRLLMNWIYGIDSPGMLHRLCFPKKLLSRLLRESGFVDLRATRIDACWTQPTLRITCRKPDTYLVYQILCETRRNLVDAGVVDLDDQVRVLDQEALLQKLVSAATQVSESDVGSALRQTLLESALTSPRVGLEFISLAIERGLLDSQKSWQIVVVLKLLASLDFSSIMVHMLKEMPIETGSQRQALTTVRAMSEKVVEKLLDVQSRGQVVRDLERTREEMGLFTSVDPFTETQLKRLADRELARGRKAFANDHIPEAIGILHEVLKLDRDNLAAVWNLARAERKRGSKEQSMAYYAKAKLLASLSGITTRRRLFSQLKRETESLSRGSEEEFDEPIDRFA
jgi:predicted SAM-dependent methyltransferase